MSRVTGRGALPMVRGGEQAAKMLGRCVGPSRSGRGVRRPWGKRWAAGMSQGRGARRRPRSSVWEPHCVIAERMQDCRQPRGRRRAAETAEAARTDEASGTSGVAGSIEAVRDPGAVWVNGAVGEPEVMGPAGAVWVTGTGEEETDHGIPRGCDRKGRPGSLGHESILELWLKVQAMRAASGCGEGSRVELHPVLAEWPVERGLSGCASWVETSRGGLTGPWVKGQVFPLNSGISTAMTFGAAYERASSFCGQGQARRMPSRVGVPRAVETHLLGRGQAVGVPGVVEEIGYGVAPGPWGKGEPMRVSGTLGWPEAVGVPRAVEGERGCGGAPGLWGRGQSVQVPGALAQEAVCGDTPGLWGSGQAAGMHDAVVVPRAAEEETASVGAPGMWLRRQAAEEIGSGGLWGSEQPVGVPCATEEEARRRGNTGFRERGQAVWAETGSGGDSSSWGATHTAELCGPSEQEAGSGGAPGLWGTEQAVDVHRALEKERGCACVTGLWGTGQSMELSQAVVVPGAMEGETGCGCVPGWWERQQAQGEAVGVPLAEAVPGLLGEETRSGNAPSLWERRQPMEEQEALVPTPLGVAGPVDQEAGYGDASCLCGRRQAVGISETVGIPKAAGVPKHRRAPAGVPVAAGVPRIGKVPAAVSISSPVCQESSSRDVLNPWEQALKELWSVGEDSGSEAFPGSWGRRQAVGASMAPEVPGLMGETGSGRVPRSWGRRQRARVPGATEVPTAPSVPGLLEVEIGSGGFSALSGTRKTAGVPVTAGVSTAGEMPMAPRVPRLVWEETVSGRFLGLLGERETAGGPADAKGLTGVGFPTSVRMPGPMEEKMGSGGISDLLRGRQTAGVSMAVGLPGPVGGETLSGGLLGLSGRRQNAGMCDAARVSMAVGVPTASGVPGLMLGDSSSGDDSGIWGRRQATELPTASSEPVEGETGSEGISGLRRMNSGAAPEAVRVPLPLGVLAAVGVPVVGRLPATVWVTGSTGEAADVGVSGLTVVRRQSTEGAGASREETGGRSDLGLAGRSQAMGVSYTCGCTARQWSCPRSVGEEMAYENVPGVSGTRTAVGVPPDSRKETGLGHFRDHPQSGRRQAGGGSAVRVRGNNFRENYVGDRLREMFQ
ncbi:collagen, type I, alpha 1b [Cynocephalus volans]|uniref:collagen, type I, alpha 1b n=1 Tax=Cynocephalus volans TaxID=110931 RepID=UPI002FCC213D